MDHLPAGITLEDFNIKKLKALILKAEQGLKTKERQISRDHDQISNYVDVRENFIGETLSATIEAELESLDLKNRRARGPSSIWLTSKNTVGTSNNALNISNYPGITELMSNINGSNFVDENWQLDSCLISCLATAKKTISLHSDNEKDDICQNSPFRAVRTVEFTDLDNKLVKSFTPDHGGLYVMKEGSQSFLKHRVPAGQHIDNGNNVRYSLSFRRFLDNKTTPDGQDDAASSSVTHSDRNTHRLRAVVFAGDSHFARLDPQRLHKDKIKVFNISRGGSKMRDDEKALCDFYVNHSHNFHTEKIFLCIGTNDIRYCQDGVGFLTKPLTQLHGKARELFPNRNIVVQNLLPLPITKRYVASNVLDFNCMLFKACTRFKCMMLNVFDKFLDRNDFRSRLLFPANDRNVHLNPAGLGKLAKMYLTIIHSNYFNPLLMI